MTAIPTLSPDQSAQLDALMLEHFGPSAADIGETDTLWTSHELAPLSGVSASLKAATGKAPQFDSLDKVDFLMSVEDEFRVTIHDAIAVTINTKAELRTHLATLLAPDASAH